MQSFGQKCLPAPHRTATTKIITSTLPASSRHYRHVTGIKNTMITIIRLYLFSSLKLVGQSSGHRKQCFLLIPSTYFILHVHVKNREFTIKRHCLTYSLSNYHTTHFNFTINPVGPEEKGSAISSFEF